MLVKMNNSQNKRNKYTIWGPRHIPLYSQILCTSTLQQKVLQWLLNIFHVTKSNFDFCQCIFTKFPLLMLSVITVPCFVFSPVACPAPPPACSALQELWHNLTVIFSDVWLGSANGSLFPSLYFDYKPFFFF